MPTTGIFARLRNHRTLAIVGGALAVVAVTAFVLSSRGAASKLEASTKVVADKAKDGKEKEPAAVAVAAVEVGSISSFSSAAANLVAEDEVKVVAEAEGRVVRLLVEEGSSVQRGQTLVQIDPKDAQFAVERAELGLRNAELILHRSETMGAERLISPHELDKARFDRDQAAQALSEARHRLTKTTVVAPFSGTITVRRVQLGQSVKPGEELFTLADFEPLVARIFLPEREVLDLRPGQEVRLALRAREEIRFTGRIRQISPVVDTASGTVKITVEAVRPPESVRPGAFVTAEVVRETRAQALLVPRAAVVRELRDAYVFVIEAKVARKRAVEVGLEEGDRVQITKGVKAGEQVVTSGQGALKDEAKVQVADARGAL